MKLRTRLTALALALILLSTLTAGASAASAPEAVTAYLDYGVSVAYNFEPQILRDAGGNRVYPLFYQDTVYLPVRAIGNLLGLGVDWEESTRTVLLGESAAGPAPPPAGAPPVSGTETVTAYLDPGITVRYNGDAQTLRDAAGNQVYPISYRDTTYLPIRAVSGLLGVKVYWDGDAQRVLLGSFASADAEILGEARVGCGWVEIDWSTAGSGYFRVRLTQQITDYVRCTASWRKKGGNSLSRPYNGSYDLTLDQWTVVPLLAGSTEYTVSVAPVYSGEESGPPEEESRRDPFRISFSANVDGFDLDSLFLMSTGYVDYENAPEACAVAQEITQNCTTDAEKITAVYHYVSENIQYDHDLVERELAAIDAGRPAPPRDLALDHILESGKGVCEHIALLMAGMLRSLGIPCKVVSGQVTTPGVSGGHVWVSVSPGTGELDLETLGAGTDGGWIRLDPTNYQSPAITSVDSYYSARAYC